MVVGRAYNRFQNVPFGLIKKESDTERLTHEIQYYKTISRDVNKAIFFPRLVASHFGTPNWMMIERYGYANLGQYAFVVMNAKSKFGTQWSNVFDELIPILSQFETFVNAEQVGTSANAHKMYIEKTETEYMALTDQRTDLQAEGLFDADYITIDGKNYGNFWVVWEQLKPFLETRLNYTSTMIHGDFCFSNILYSPEGLFKFIDPRGSFGKVGIYGDNRYDIAKLYHSVDGNYEAIINDYFSIDKLSPTQFDISWNFLKSEKRYTLKMFDERFFQGGFDKKEIKIIEGCIFIGMCARHYDSHERQLAMYLTGIKLLNEALEL